MADNLPRPEKLVKSRIIAIREGGDGMTTTPISKLERHELASAIMLLKHRCGQLGMFKTMHAMEPATRAVGYELAE